MSGFLWVPVVVAVVLLAGAVVACAWVKVSDLRRARDARWVRAEDVERLAGARVLAIAKQIADRAREHRTSYDQAAAEEVSG